MTATLTTACILSLTIMNNDLMTNPAGVPWVDTNDEWGRTWADAASDFYDRLDAQRARLAAQGVPADAIEFAVGTDSSLRKVFQPKLWFKGDMSGAVQIEAARGEYEGFQLVVCPIAEGERKLTKLSDEKTQGHASLEPKSVNIRAIEVSTLKQIGGAGRIEPERIRLYRVGYVPTLPPQYPVMHVGDWPDPLLPLEPFDVSNPLCQPVWVEVQVPRDAPPGGYEGHITVRGPHDVRIDVSLHVWDFALPDPPAHVSMGWSLHNWFKNDGIESLLERLRVLLDHRLAPWHVAYDHHESPADHDRIMSLLLSRGVKLQQTSGKPPASFVEHLRVKGWLDHYVCVWGDEPHERDYPTYQARTDEIREAYPGLTVAMTEEPGPHNQDLFDMWIAEPSAQNDTWVQDAMRRGDRVWWYLCQLPIHASYEGPIHACPGMIVDRPAIDHRITYWHAFKQNIEGVSYWAVSAWPAGFEGWPQKPWPPNARMNFPYSGQHNANGFLCYPGADGMPWPSIRLKCMRDGLEDQDYLTILRQRAGDSPTAAVKRLLDVPSELAVGLRYYNKDPRVLLAVRRQIAQEIEVLGGR